VNCDECKEQVVELIEREAIDPEGVREILAKCPDCRKAFDEIKATLVVARHLPMEAPPDHLDISILRAAEERAKVQAPPPSSWRQQLAMAAVALLVVGIGVSTMSIIRRPAEEQLAEAPADRADADDLNEFADSPEPEGLAGGSAELVGDLEALAVAEVSENRAAAPPAQAPGTAASERARASTKSSSKKKEARKAVRRSPTSLAQQEALPVQEPQAAAGARPEADAVEEAVAAEPARGAKAAPTAARFETEVVDAAVDREQQCKNEVSALEKRTKDDAYRPTPEEELRIGRCYQLLGQRKKAKQWLRRAAEHPSTSARAKEALEELR
jgi:hypothetical protein